jgi:hypothetical protein
MVTSCLNGANQEIIIFYFYSINRENILPSQILVFLHESILFTNYLQYH